MLLDIVSSGGRMTDTPKTFGQHLLAWLAKEGMSQNELATKLEKSPTYVNYLARDINPSAKGRKAIRLAPEIADRIADILNVPKSAVRDAAGLASGERDQTLDESVQRLLRYYSELPQECQDDVLALTETLWKRRRAEGRVERKHLTHVGDIPAVAEFKPKPNDHTVTPRKRRRA
jgi:transcriptional regulator with XRE-family HTH domain